MSFAFRNIILNQSTLSQSGGRLSIGGVPLAFLSEAAGGVTGLTVASGDARYVSLTGAQTISGAKVFAGSLDVGNRYLLSSDGYNVLDWEDRVLATAGATKLDWGVNEVYGVWTHTGAASSSGHIANYHAVTGYSYPRLSNPSGYVTGSVVRPTETGSFVTSGQTGNFYPRSNPSGYLTGIPSDVVRTTGAQTISGAKTFSEAGELRGRWKYTGHTAFTNDIVMPDDIASYRNVTDYAYPAYNPSGYFSRSGASVLYATYGPSYPSVDLDQGILYTNYYVTSGHSIDYNGMNLYNGQIGGSRKLRANWDVGELYDNNEYQSIIWTDRSLCGTGGFSDVRVSWNTSYIYTAAGEPSIDWSSRWLFRDSENLTLDWQAKILYENWSAGEVPVSGNHIANKAYVDSVAGSSSGAYTLQLSHNQFSPADASTYYMAGAVGHTPITTQASSPVLAVPTSGVLRKVVGTAFVAGTLGTSETISLIVYKNGASVATGSYLASGRNNTIVSGLSGLSVPVAYLDTLQLAMVCPTWTTNPVNLTNSLTAYISLG